MEKVGERLLAGFIRLDITRRLFLIGRLARNIQRGSFAARSAYLTNNPNIVIRASEDLLELFELVDKSIICIDLLISLQFQKIREIFTKISRKIGNLHYFQYKRYPNDV